MLPVTKRFTETDSRDPAPVVIISIADFGVCSAFQDNRQAVFYLLVVRPGPHEFDGTELAKEPNELLLSRSILR